MLSLEQLDCNMHMCRILIDKNNKIVLKTIITKFCFIILTKSGMII